MINIQNFHAQAGNQVIEASRVDIETSGKEYAPFQGHG